MDNKWRLIIDDAKDAYTNMAIDKALMAASKIPTVRFYRWDPPAVSIGCFQGLKEEVDIKKCEALGINFVRRITGGGAVFHDKELTYSISLDEKNPFIPFDLLKSYEKICGAIILGLKQLNIKAQYAPLNDIVVAGKKISGCAQTRREGKLLQHGTLLLEVEPEKMFSVLKIPNEKIRDKMISSSEERVTSIYSQLNKKINYLQVAAAIRKGFEEHFGIVFFEEKLSEKEQELAQKIKEEQFIKKEWNYAR